MKIKLVHSEQVSEHLYKILGLTQKRADELYQMCHDTWESAEHTIAQTLQIAVDKCETAEEVVYVSYIFGHAMGMDYAHRSCPLHAIKGIAHDGPVEVMGVIDTNDAVDPVEAFKAMLQSSFKGPRKAGKATKYGFGGRGGTD